MREPPDRGQHTSLPRTLEPPVPLNELPTPALLVDEARLTRNLRGMQALAGRAGVRLRPHVKTHKAPEIARLQAALGAEGLCTAKTGEAEAFADAGHRDLLVAYTIVGRRAVALAGLAARLGPSGRVGACIDSEAGLAAMASAANDAGTTLDVWVEIDSGLHRSGLLPGDPLLVTLVAAARRSRSLRFHGLLTHAGQVYRSRPDEVDAVARDEGDRMAEAARALETAGLGPVAIGLGSTPTVPVSAFADGVSEIHPGVYVFGDRQQVRLRAMSRDDVALTVLATVMGRPARDRWVLDAGSKTLSSDQGAHGVKGLDGFGEIRLPREHAAPADPDALPFVRGLEPAATPGGPEPVTLTRLSEEHGVIEGAFDFDAAPGDLVEIVPNHACPAANLAETLWVTRGEGAGRVAVAAWPVAARARTF